MALSKFKAEAARLRRPLRRLLRQRLPAPGKSHIMLALVVIMSLGAGFVAGRLTAPAKIATTPHAHTTPLAQGSSTHQDVKAQTAKNYERSLTIVNQDLGAGRLTKAQAAALKSKLAEVYTYRTAIALNPTGAARDELRAQRKEWQKWAQQNHLSLRYFVPLY